MCRSCLASTKVLLPTHLGLLSALKPACVDGGARQRAAWLSWRATRSFCLQMAFRGRLPSMTATHWEPQTSCNYALSNRTLDCRSKSAWTLPAGRATQHEWLKQA